MLACQRWLMITSAVLAILCLGPLKAQQNRGSIVGSITDPSGAAVVGASIAAINVETGVSYKGIITDVGTYTIPALPSGTYRVEAELAGFKKYVRQPVLISTATSVGLSVQMEVGDITQQIAVTGAPPLLQTQEVTLGTVVEDKMIRDLPVALGRDTAIGSGRRQATAFIFITPGVSGNEFSKTVNGMQQRATEVSVEGGVLEGSDHFGQVANATPPYDAVAEFKVIQGIPDASEGNSSSAIKLFLKSGTNEIHGSANEYIRNDVLDARGFFARTRPIVRQNEYGFTVGGPVWLPKVYNGKNKTFFFLSWGQFKVRGGGTAGIRTYPTEAFKKGDFSKLTDVQGNLIPIFDPLTAPKDGSSARAQFPDNIIPTSRIDPRASKVAQLMPTAQIDQSFNNFIGENSRRTDDWFWSLKLDHSFNDHHKISGSYWWDRADYLAFNTQPGPLTDGGATFERGGGLTLTYNWLVSARIANELRTSYTKSQTNHGNLPGVDLGPNPLDIPNYPFTSGNLFLGVEGYSRGPGASGFKVTSGTQGTQTPGPSFQIANSATWAKGSHTFKFGGERRVRKTISRGVGYWFPEFRKFQTSNPASSNFGAMGDGLASMFLGDVYNQWGQNDGNRVGMIGERTSWFVQDTWKVTRRLTLNLGLRHDIAPTGIIENGMSSFDPTVTNAGAGGRPGALRFVTTNDRFYPTTGNQLGPRLGIAYSLNGKTTFRLGYALLHQITDVETAPHGGSFQQGFNSTLPLPPSGFPSVPIYNIWKDGAPIDPNKGKLPNLDPAQVNGRGPAYFHPSSNRSSRVQQWTFNIQRQLPRNVVVEARYVGWKAQGLFSTLDNINQVDPKYLSLGSLLTANINSPAAVAAGIRAPYPGFEGSVAQALRPYPQFGRIDPQLEALGQGQHHSLQVQAQNRLNKDLLFLVNYVWAKTLSDQGLGGGFGTSGQDNYNRKLEKALQVGQPPQELKATWVYELPVGKGKRLLSGASRPLNHLVGGWALASTHRYSKGTYLGVVGGNPLPIFADSIRPNRVLGVQAQINPRGAKFRPNQDLYLNGAAFAPNAPFTFGNAPRLLSDVRSFPYYNEDVSLMKRGSLGFSEEARYELRWEIFNPLNRVIFGGPGSNINSPGTFGVVSGQGNLPRQMQFGLKVLW